MELRHSFPVAIPGQLRAKDDGEGDASAQRLEGVMVLDLGSIRPTSRP